MPGGDKKYGRNKKRPSAAAYKNRAEVNAKRRAARATQAGKVMKVPRGTARAIRRGYPCAIWQPLGIFFPE